MPVKQEQFTPAIWFELKLSPLQAPIGYYMEVTGLTAAFATMVAVHSGVGQVVDVNLKGTFFASQAAVVLFPDSRSPSRPGSVCQTATAPIARPSSISGRMAAMTDAPRELPARALGSHLLVPERLTGTTLRLGHNANPRRQQEAALVRLEKAFGPDSLEAADVR